MVNLSERERIEILCMIGVGDRIRTQQEVVDLFNETYPDRQPISQSMVSRIYTKFKNHGHVRDHAKSGRPNVSENDQLNVLLAVQENPHVSLRDIESNQAIGKSTVHKILKSAKYHPYKVKLIHELNEDDFDRRAQFCEQMQQLCNDDEDIVQNIIFTDEATFTLSGEVNRQNCRYWAKENPHWSRETHTQYPQKINVWCGIVRDIILGPYFFERTLTGEIYLIFLQNEVIPSITARFPDYDDLTQFQRALFYQQDGAPPHYAAPVRAYLNQMFPNRWIGRRGPIEWPARSPDLTPLDFFLWGYLKSKVYINRPNTLDELKIRIREEVQRITPDVLRNCQEEFRNRLGYCLAVQGAQFEHLN